MTYKILEKYYFTTECGELEAIRISATMDKLGRIIDIL